MEGLRLSIGLLFVLQVTWQYCPAGKLKVSSAHDYQLWIWKWWWHISKQYLSTGS